MVKGRRGRRRNGERAQDVHTTSASVVNDSDLPDEILFLIFTHLPTKAIYRYRCVSKRWRSLLPDPKMVEIFLSNPSSDSNPIQRPFSTLLFDQDRILNVRKVHHIDDSESNLDNSFSVDFIPLDGERIRAIASCNDLVLCRPFTGIDFYLCNFFTKQWIRISNPMTKSYDFGLLSDRIVGLTIDQDDECVVDATVFELRTGEWRQLNIWYQLETKLLRGHGGLGCNGKLYWMTMPKKRNGLIHSGVVVYEPLKNGGKGELSLIEYPTDIMCLVVHRETLWSIGVCQDQLMMAIVSRNKCHSISLHFPHDLWMSIWALENDHTHNHDDEKINEIWGLKHHVSLLDFVFEDGTSLQNKFIHDKPKENLLHVRCFHPYDRDIVYVQFQYQVLLCNLRQGTLRYTQTGRNFVFANLFVIPHPWCPSPLPEVPTHRHPYLD